MQPFCYYEETEIRKHYLPESWKDESVQENLKDFLQENWNQRKSFYDDGDNNSKQQFLTFLNFGSIRTNEYVGTIAFNGEQVNIFPKVFEAKNSSNSLDHLMSNLVQWLDYCSKLDFPFVSIKSDLTGIDNFKELFVTLFAKKLSQVLEHGSYYKYEDVVEDLRVIKGRIDINDYISRKIPNGQYDVFRCEFTTFEYDNLFNRIIKYVCKKLFNQTRPVNQKIFRNVILRMSDVSDVVCIARDCDKVILNRMQSEYRSILSLCKIFLLNDLPGYMMDTNDSFCFLFPMPLLFEGFIGGFLKSILDGKGRVELQKSDQPLINDIKYAGKSYGPAFMMRHDILCTIKDKVFLMDTKYKKIQRFEDAKEDETLWKMQLIRGVNQQDLYQVSTYAAKRNLKKAYILYPLLRFEDVESDMPILQELILTGNSSLDDIKFVDVVLVRVPFVFEDDIEKTKEALTKTLLKIFG